MACYAKVGLTGRISSEVKQSNVNGTTVINFNVAVFTTKKENEKYISDFYSVNYWGKAAETVLPRLEKGARVQVYGDLTQEEFVGKDGEKKKSMSVRANEVICLDFKAAPKKTHVEEGPDPF